MTGASMSTPKRTVVPPWIPLMVQILRRHQTKFSKMRSPSKNIPSGYIPYFSLSVFTAISLRIHGGKDYSEKDIPYISLISHIRDISRK